jgi:hypothetical protein
MRGVYEVIKIVEESSVNEKLKVQFSNIAERKKDFHEVIKEID